MAGTATKVLVTGLPGSMEHETAKQVNNIVTDLEVLRAAGQAGAVLATTELMADHATFKTAVDAIETLVEELGADHATFKTAADQTETLIEELHDDHATFKTVCDDIKAAINLNITLLGDVKTLLNNLRRYALYRVLGNPGLAIDTNFDIKNSNAITYINGGTLKTLSGDTNFDTGTAATIATAKWGVAVLTETNADAATVTWFTNAGAGYDSEALAIAAITDPAATSTVIGYVTVLAAGATWTAGTDALAGGAGGTPATTTNYYNVDAPNGLIVTAAVSSSPGTTIASSAPATLTAAKPASAPATLSASIAIPSAPATLSSPVPTGDAIDTATDLIASQLQDPAGTVIA